MLSNKTVVEQNWRLLLCCRAKLSKGSLKIYNSLRTGGGGRAESGRKGEGGRREGGRGGREGGREETDFISEWSA